MAFHKIEKAYAGRTPSKVARCVISNGKSNYALAFTGVAAKQLGLLAGQKVTIHAGTDDDFGRILITPSHDEHGRMLNAIGKSGSVRLFVPASFPGLTKGFKTSECTFTKDGQDIYITLPREVLVSPVAAAAE